MDFETCVMEQSNELQNTSLETSFNVTNQSSHSSRLSNGNVSFLKRRLFEDEEDDDVNLLPEDDEQDGPSINTVTSTQKVRSPPRCDSETEVNQMNKKMNMNFLCLSFSRMIIEYLVRLIDSIKKLLLYLPSPPFHHHFLSMPIVPRSKKRLNFLHRSFTDVRVIFFFFVCINSCQIIIFLLLKTHIKSCVIISLVSSFPFGERAIEKDDLCNSKKRSISTFSSG